jgi:hypothetical protein
MQLDQRLSDIRHGLARHCDACIKEVFSMLLDPQVQHLLAPYLVERDGLVRLHVHDSQAISKGVIPMILFDAAVYINKDIVYLCRTPAASTVEKAFANLRETFRRERARLNDPLAHRDTLP